jgi:hypothetical protein
MSTPERRMCADGSHDLTAWAYSAAGSCLQEQRCQRIDCTKRDTRTVHTGRWSEYRFLAAGSCEQTRRCLRCSADETRTEHGWTAWAPLTSLPSPCTLSRSCPRCGAAEQKDEHRFTQWRLQGPEPCAPFIRACPRCDRMESREKPGAPPHVWHEDVLAPCTTLQRVCRTCRTAELIEVAARHDWESIVHRPPFNPRVTKYWEQCRRCGATTGMRTTID